MSGGAPVAKARIGIRRESMARTREELLDYLKDLAKLYRGMASEYEKEAEAEKQNMLGLFWLHRGKTGVYNTVADGLEDLVKKESK
jgi:hypothetical protein